MTSSQSDTSGSSTPDFGNDLNKEHHQKEVAVFNSPELQALLAEIIALDLETTSQGAIRHIGAYYNPVIGHPEAPVLSDRIQQFEYQGGKRKEVMAALQGLDAFCQPCRFVLGHNLIGHDLPVLQSLQPGLQLLSKPVIDTLFLSPLAFPRNPYHRLVKDYKLVKDAINDPVADARLALSIFVEQYQSFWETAQNEPDLIRFYHFCFATGQPQDEHSGQSGDELPEVIGASFEGMSAVFQTLIDRPFTAGPDVLQALVRLCKGLVCPK
ncbi:hypothetical protein [Salinisphaera sp. G21_0]|uniref:hypothetical protein n=1 Tax=Salinisphaera sp. G21_0 TaxID=2821094 RepID=UPI001ADC5D19|nr:hypothetical protein [Salinisphaera sp. G21_0]MBO9482684.1 hypothetical protein [Salinisphaera sp. G21_0]